MTGEQMMFGHEHVEKMVFTGPRQGDPGAAVCGTREDGSFWCSGSGAELEMALHAEKIATMKQTPQATVGDLSRTGTIEPMKNTTPHTCRCKSVGDLCRTSGRT